MNAKRLATKLAAKYGVRVAYEKVGARFFAASRVANLHKMLVWSVAGTALERIGAGRNWT